MTILLTGATGFLGSHLLNRLLKLNYNVIILKRSTSNTWRIDSLLPRIRSYDIDKIEIEKPFIDQRIDVVIHTATNYGRKNSKVSDVVYTNLFFSVKLLETATLFNTDIFLNTDTLLYKYLNSYSLSKKQFVEWLKYFSNKIRVVNLKIEHIYGPKDDNTKFVTWIINQMLQNVDSIDLTEGNQKRDFIFVDDVVDVYLLMLEKYKSFQKFSEFDVGTGCPIKLKDFVIKIYEEIKRLQPIKTILNFGAIPYREGEIMEIQEDIKPLIKLGWRPKVSLEEGIRIILQEERGKDKRHI